MLLPWIQMMIMLRVDLSQGMVTNQTISVSFVRNKGNISV